MNGAYCVTCREDGPDLVMGGENFEHLPIGTLVRLTFTCGNCQARCAWTITKTAAGLVYRPDRRDVH